MTPRSPVDPDRYIGTVTQVTAAMVQANLPHATARPERRRLARGAVGDFVFIDCELITILGRIIEVKIPDGERLTVEPALGTGPDPNPVGRIQLLASLESGSPRLRRGMKSHPRIGDSVFLADPELFAELVASSTGDPGDVTIDLGNLDAAGGCPIRFSAEKFFGRHCGVLGTTGGGKSWTIATLLLEIRKAGGKAILFDPTGEFAGVAGISAHYTFNDVEPSASLVHFPYQHATEDDLFVLFRPSGQSQGPKLRDAIKSLKLVTALGRHPPNGVTIRGGNLIKRLQPRQPFFTALDAHKDAVHSQYCHFEISKLPEQIAEECIWSSGQGVNTDNWGNTENGALSYCESLVSRMRTQINALELSCLFATSGRSVVDILAAFFEAVPGRLQEQRCRHQSPFVERVQSVLFCQRPDNCAWPLPVN